MNAGDLNKRVIIQSRSSAQDDYGAPLDSWSDIAEVWADIQPLRGLERFNAQQTEAAIDHKVILRYRSGLNAKQRLKYGTRFFDIESIIDINERHEILELMCKEAV